jgi:hypothetical protein
VIKLSIKDTKRLKNKEKHPRKQYNQDNKYYNFIL